MKYTITINQRAAVENFDIEATGLDMNDFALAEFAAYWSSLDSTRKTVENGRVWFWLKWDVVKRQMPLLGIKSYNTFWRRINKLIENNLIIAHSDNQTKGQAYYAMGANWNLYSSSCDLLQKSNTPYCTNAIPPIAKVQDNKTIEDKTIEYKEEQVIAREENSNHTPPPKTAYQLGQDFAGAMRLEMQTRADGLASYQKSPYKGAADSFLEKCVMNIATAAQSCYRHENAKNNLTEKVAQAYGRLLFNRFEALCENGNGTSRFLHTQTTFEQTLMHLSQYSEDFICDVLSEATMGGWENPKTDAAILAEKHNKWIFSRKQTENLAKVRDKVESAEKAAKNAFSVAIGVLTNDEIDMVNRAAKANKVSKRSDNADLKAAARRAYAAVMYMRTKDKAYNQTIDANGAPMGLQAERDSDAVYTAAYEIIRANYKNW